MAKGLGGLLGVGREQKRQALAGLTRAAQLETQTDTINRQLKAQKRAAEMNVLGTAGGIVGAQALSGNLSLGVKAADKALKIKKAQETAAAMNLATGEGVSAALAAEKAATAATAGTAGSGSVMASIGAAAPYVLLAIAGGYLLKKIFD